MPILKYAVVWLIWSLSFPVFADDLSVEINGVSSSKGRIIVCLWGSSDGFPICPRDAPNRQTVDAMEGAVVTFGDLVPGDYAVTAFHDKDDNGKLKQNFIGIPKEPAAVSGPKQRRMGPPKFSGAVVPVLDSVAITLTLG